MGRDEILPFMDAVEDAKLDFIRGESGTRALRVDRDGVPGAVRPLVGAALTLLYGHRSMTTGETHEVSQAKSPI
jgi:hypothetical protein